MKQNKFVEDQRPATYLLLDALEEKNDRKNKTHTTKSWPNIRASWFTIVGNSVQKSSLTFWELIILELGPNPMKVFDSKQPSV